MTTDIDEIFPSIWVFKNGFDKSEWLIDSIEKSIEDDIKLNWQWARTSNELGTEDYQGSYRTNKLFSVSSNQHHPLIAEIDKHIFDSVTLKIAEYSANYNVGTLTDEGYAVLKYEPGTEYRLHHDCGGAHRNRVLSMLVYLNDDYVGGHLEFPHIRETYYPSAGDVLLFPSNYTFAHIAHPVTSGTKYAIVSWLAYAV
jgi:predicted 2-oxoglutarate/Fe(II)-dependent dioxygenase YbiX